MRVELELELEVELELELELELEHRRKLHGADHQCQTRLCNPKTT